MKVYYKMRLGQKARTVLHGYADEKVPGTFRECVLDSMSNHRLHLMQRLHEGAAGSQLHRRRSALLQ